MDVAGKIDGVQFQPLKGLVKVAAEEVAAQRERLFVWVPVFLGLGIGLYFSLPFEPPLVLMSLLAVFLAAVWVLVWPLKESRYFLCWLCLSGVCLILGGFVLSQWRTASLDTVMLAGEVRIADVTGWVADIDQLEEGQGYRLILEDPVIENVPTDKTPKRIRIKVRGDRPVVGIGDKVQVLAGLNPPSPPVAPGAFDFQRYAFFKGIGAFGFAYRTPEIVEKGQISALRQRLEIMRQKTVARIGMTLNGAQAAVAAALMTGERGAIAEKDWEALRRAGLAHMLAISGLHVGLVSGIVFFFFRLILAAVPRIALYHPIKKYAAIAAFLAAFGYTLLVGSTVPTVRALLMVGLVLFAVVVDRVALSLRLVALAALVVLLFWPDALWSASFQMSFAAVTALIVFYDKIREHLSRWHREAGFLRKLALYIVGVGLTDIVATAATMPFALYHFQYTGAYSLLANLFAGPVLVFLVMPFVTLSYALMPFGLEAPALWVAGKGVGLILTIAHEVTDLPESVLLIEAWPFPVFLLLVTAGIILLLWKGYGRMAALVPLIMALMLAHNHSPPDILVSDNGSLTALRDGKGKLHLSSLQKERFIGAEWLRRNGEAVENKSRWPAEGKAIDQLSCGEFGCRYRDDRQAVAFSFHPGSLNDDCKWADILISRDPVTSECKARLVVDRFDVWRNGAYAIWLDGRYSSVRSVRGTRPWTQYGSDK